MNTIIQENFRKNSKINTTYQTFFHQFHIASLFSKSHIKKQKGVPVSKVFQFLFLLPFHHHTGHRTLTLHKNVIEFRKDVMYRFLANPSFQWTSFLLNLSVCMIKKFFNPLTNKDRKEVFILDDSVIHREKSKKAEHLSWIFDHVKNKCVRGYALLTLLWSDGNSKIPLTFALHSNKKQLIQDRSISNNKVLNHKSHDSRIREESLMDKNSASINLIHRALKSGLNPSFILYDSWFGFPRFYLHLLKLFNVHSICRIKKMLRVYYEYNGKFLNLKKLYSVMKSEKRNNKNTDKRNKSGKNQSSELSEEILGSIVVKASFDKTKEGLVKIVFIRNRNKKQEWIAFLSTDTSLTDEEIVQTYAKRWGIETFFKVMKELLQAEDEFQLINFTSMYAHLTVTMTRYCLLSWLDRCAKDDRSKGDLFYQMCEELKDIGIREALFLCFEYIMECISSFMLKKNADVVTKHIFSMFTNLIPLWIEDSKRVSMCEV